MPVLTQLLHKKARGPILNNEDWWHLVFDTDTNRLYVEHEWDHVDVRGGGKVDAGSTQMDIEAFLSTGWGPEHRELVRLISDIFETKTKS